MHIYIWYGVHLSGYAIATYLKVYPDCSCRLRVLG